MFRNAMARLLLAVFLSLCYYSSSSAQQATTSGQTGDIIVLGNGWTGTLSQCTQNVDCWAGTTDQGDIHEAQQTANGTTYYWSGTQQTLSNTIAINQALQAAGIQVDGFDYQWVYKNGNSNYFSGQPGGGGVDPFEIVVNVYDSNGNLFKSYKYDYGQNFANWTYDQGTETFNQNFLTPSYFGNVEILVTGQDIAGQAGYWGPEFRADESYIYVNYSADPCYNNQLYDPACPGYAQALFNQQCTQNPLYDPSCPGYQAAWLQQQCAANPLVDPTCPGYAVAYYNQQCIIDPLYDVGCPGYQTALATCNTNYHLNDSKCPNYATNTQNCVINALYDSNCYGYKTAYNTCVTNYHLNDSLCPDYTNNFNACTINPLIDTNCSGYATAYFNQQCSLNPLYDPNCSGYNNAQFTQQCNTNPKSDPQCPDYYIAMCKEDPLYDRGCVDYDVAYFNQQCSLDPQYDNTCPGYVDLSGNDGEFTVLSPLVDDIINAESIQPEIYETPVDTVAQEEIVIEQEQAEADSGFQTVDDDINEELGELEMMDDIDAELAKLEEESSNKGDSSETGVGNTNQEDDIEKELAELENSKPEYVENIPGKAMPKVDPVTSKNNKMRLLIAMKAIETVKELEAAVTLEQQMEIQRRLLALISFVPDFKTYAEKEQINQINFYPPKPTVDHAFARWFLNDPGFAAMENLQYQ